MLAVPSPMRGDLPTTRDNGNASRTVTWNMTDSIGMTVDNATLAGGNATLPWQYASIEWNRPEDFVGNGTLDPGVVANESGISLWGNRSNHVAGGDFGPPGDAWNYTEGKGGNVTATWNSTQHVAQLDHVAASTESLWEGLDASVQTNWFPFPSIATINENTTGMKQGPGMMGVRVGATWLGTYLGIVNFSSTNTALDWSHVDRMVLWVQLNVSLPIGFNITAVRSSGNTVGTANQSLSKGWQELTVDLDQLGDPAERTALKQVTLRFNGVAVPIGTWFNVDDVRLGWAKDFTETASVYQLLNKTNATSPHPGSALLSLDWRMANVAGALGYAPSVNLTTGSLSYGAKLDSLGSSQWHHVSLDVSASTSAAGVYNLSVRLWVAVDTTAPTNVSMFVDNVSLIIPDRHNGTFLSDPLTMGCDSDYVQLSWIADVPTGATLEASIRSGNSSDTSSGTWSQWQTFSTPGTHSLDVPGGTFFLVQAALRTTNASRTPVLVSLSLLTRHHLHAGTLKSDLYPALGDLLEWGTFNATTVTPDLTSVAFFVGNGSDWTQVTPGASISFLQGARFQWRAVLTSSDLLVTPSVHDVRVTYEYLGKPASIRVFHDGIAIMPGEVVSASVGEYVRFSATVSDAGSHVLPSPLAPLIWQSDDTSAPQMANGSYLPSSPGLHWVNVTVSGYMLFASVRVNVSGVAVQPTVSSLWDLWPAYAVAVAAVVGFGVYEVAIRRMFAIDDVFLIGKDGRLMIHNTRRMRADRDEDILSGMLTAIMSFLRDQDPEENGDLKRFEVGGKTTLLERGRHVYLTVIYSGRVPRWAGKDLHRFMTDLEARFGDAFARWDGSPEDLHGLKEFMGGFVSRVRYRGEHRSGARAS